MTKREGREGCRVNVSLDGGFGVLVQWQIFFQFFFKERAFSILLQRPGVDILRTNGVPLAGWSTLSSFFTFSPLKMSQLPTHTMSFRKAFSCKFCCFCHRSHIFLVFCPRNDIWQRAGLSEQIVLLNSQGILVLLKGASQNAQTA
jgi:hypothetical protein